MATGPITKASVEALKCPETKDREILWDGGHREAVRGFGVAAYRNGGKVYLAQYRKDGRSRRTRIGEHGRLTPEQARAEARGVLGLVEKGADPIAARKAAREVPTFRMVADDFLSLHVEAKRKKRTGDEYRRIINARLMPSLASKRIVEIRRADMTKLHGALRAHPFEANRALAVFSAIWNWAAGRDIVSVDKNPARGIERYPEQSRERYLTGAELGRLGDALREGETLGFFFAPDLKKPKSKHSPKPETRRQPLDPYATAAIRLLILTGARLREILHLEWSHVDIERGLLFLPDSKTGKKSIYLSAAALDVLTSLAPVKGNPFVIAGGADGKPRADLKRPWNSVRKAAGLDEVRLHDLRHSFASIGAGASLGLPIIGKLLGHSQARTTQRYAHLDADPLRRAVDTIGSTISAAMDAGAPCNVVDLKKGGRR